MQLVETSAALVETKMWLLAAGGSTILANFVENLDRTLVANGREPINLTAGDVQFAQPVVPKTDTAPLAEDEAAPAAISSRESQTEQHNSVSSSPEEGSFNISIIVTAGVVLVFLNVMFCLACVKCFSGKAGPASPQKLDAPASPGSSQAAVGGKCPAKAEEWSEKTSCSEPEVEWCDEEEV